MVEVLNKIPNHSEFLANLHTDFNMSARDGLGESLFLVDVGNLVENGSMRTFSLLFRAPVDIATVQNIYQLTHESLGSMELFLVPVKKDADGVYFEAIFNDLVT